MPKVRKTQHRKPIRSLIRRSHLTPLHPPTYVSLPQPHTPRCSRRPLYHTTITPAHHTTISSPTVFSVHTTAHRTAAGTHAQYGVCGCAGLSRCVAVVLACCAVVLCCIVSCALVRPTPRGPLAAAHCDTQDR